MIEARFIMKACRNAALPRLNSHPYNLLRMINLTQARKTELLGMTGDELRELMVGLGEKPFRARQLHDAMGRRRITSFDQMTDLPKTLRRLLDEHAVVTCARVESVFS